MSAIRTRIAGAAEEAEGLAEVLMDWTGDGALDHDALMLDIEAFVDQYRGVPLGQLRLGAMLNEVATILRHHRLALPSDLSSFEGRNR